MTLQFRNVDVGPDQPVERWGFEGLLAAVDRGGLLDWRRISRVVEADPWGEVAQTLDQVFEVGEDTGAVAAVCAARDLARAREATRERAENVTGQPAA